MENVCLNCGLERKEWWWDDSARMVFLHLLFHCDGDGCTEISLHDLAVGTRLSVKNVRTAIGKLEKAGEVARLVAKKTARITFNDIERYKDSGQTKRQDKRQEEKEEVTTDSRTTKGRTKAEKEEAMRKRMKDFYASLIPYVSTYGKAMVRDFYNYWSEPNKSHSSMRFESERTWDLVRRLDYWQKRSATFSGRGAGDKAARFEEGLDKIGRMFNDGAEQRTEAWEFPDGPDEQ